MAADSLRYTSGLAVALATVFLVIMQIMVIKCYSIYFADCKGWQNLNEGKVFLVDYTVYKSLV